MTKDSNEKESNAIRYASFGTRLYANAVDIILLLLVMMPLFPSSGMITEVPQELQKLAYDAQAGLISAREFYIEFFKFLVTSGALAKFMANSLMQFTVMGIIFVTFWIYKSATPGKMLFKIKIVDAETLGEPSKLQLIGRYLGYFISAIPLMLGFFWIVIDKKKQGWHDKISRTLVIYTTPEDTPEQKEKKFRLQTIFAIVILVLFLIYFISR